MNDYQCIYYPESRFGGFTDIDGTILFYARVNALVNSSSVVLDIGCGRGSYGDDQIKIRRDLRILKGRVNKVIGIDIDRQAVGNPFLDEFHLIDGENWCIPQGSIDLCIADFVLEHIKTPDNFFRECSRVLKPNGYLCIRTPNLLSYFGLISKMVPNRFHGAVLKAAQKGRREEDIFPTLYKCNTKRKLQRMLESYQFDGLVYEYEAEPSYLSFSKVLYFLGVLHQRFAPKNLKVSLFAFAKKVISL